MTDDALIRRQAFISALTYLAHNPSEKFDVKLTADRRAKELEHEMLALYRPGAELKEALR